MILHIVFTMQGVFSLCILCCGMFFVVYFMLCYVLAPYFAAFPEPNHTFHEPKHTFPEPKHTFSESQYKPVCRVTEYISPR